MNNFEELAMGKISNLGYVVLGVSHLDKWETFAVDILGLQLGAVSTENTISLRMDEFEQRIQLIEGDDDLVATGWELDTHSELDSYVAGLESKGVKLVEADNSLLATRCVERMYYCDDPNGFKHEFYTGSKRAPVSNSFRSTVLKKGFNTGRLGVGHVLPVAKSGPETIDFYNRVLGLSISDYIREEIAPEIVADATFFHASTGRHHSIATAEMPSKKIMHHMMIQVDDMDDVGLAFERCVDAGYPILMGLGHHPNDKMFSFYVETPSGWAMEFGWGGIVIDDDNWEIKSYSQLSDWGHKPAVIEQA